MIVKVVDEVTLNSYKSFEEIVKEPQFEGFDWETSQKVLDSYKTLDKFEQLQFMPVVYLGSLVANEVIVCI